MQPTYTLAELKERIPELDNEGIKTLQQLINEEMKRYSYGEVIRIYELMMKRVRELQAIALNNFGISDVFYIKPDDIEPH